jgi:hypothetical protein
MLKPELFDVVEMLYPIPGTSIVAGESGTIVHVHDSHVFEVEFANQKGETSGIHTVSRDQFIIIWQAATGAEVALAEQVAQVVALLPADAKGAVLDFARFLSWQRSKEVESVA